MHADEQFKQYFNSEIAPKLADMEAERKPIAFKIKFFYIFFSVLFLGFLIYTIINYSNLGVFIFTVLLVALLALVFALACNLIISRKYRAKYKVNIMSRMVTFLGTDFKFLPELKVPYPDFVESKMFNFQPYKYEGDDLVAGKIDEDHIFFSELRIRWFSKQKDGSMKIQYAFKGTFLIADTNKKVKHPVVFMPHLHHLSHLHGFDTTALATNDKFKVNHPEFEKLFEVLCDDERAVETYTTNDILDLVLEIKNTIKKPIILSIADGKICLAIGYKDTILFPPRITKSIIDADYIFQSYHFIQTITSLIEKIKR